jgi:hypothetical protein
MARKYICHKCADEGRGEKVPAQERYSMGIYAGMYCDDDWKKDGRNHDRPFDPADAGERMDPEDP